MVCINNLTFGVTRAESLLATPLSIGVYNEKVPEKDIVNNAWTEGVRSTNTLKYIYFGLYVCVGITAKYWD